MIQRLSGIVNNGSSSGVVRDQATYETLPGVTIELLSTTGPTGTYYTADSNGSFVVPTYGVYGLRFTAAEHAPVDISPSSVGENMAVYLVPTTKTLPGITITANKKTNTLMWLLIAVGGYYAYKKLF